MDRSTTLNRYLIVVTLVGLGVATAAAWGEMRAPARPSSVLALGALVLVGEMVPLRVPFHGGREDVTLSTTFVFALLLTGAHTFAILAQVAASVSADVIARKPWWKTLFNGAQYAIAVATAGLVLRAFGSDLLGSGSHVDVRLGLGILASGLTLYAVNNLLIGTAVALAQSVSFRTLLRNDMLFQAAVMFVLISEAPLLLIAIDRSVWLLPMFLPAVFVAYVNGRTSVQRDHDAAHDALTQLPNRAMLETRLHDALAADRKVALLLVGLDRFREVNDTLGHNTGDRLLVACARRLEDELGDVGLVARLGGDIFVVLAENVDRAVLADVAAEVRASFAAPFDVDGVAFRLEASIGAALSPEHGDAPELLVQHAEVAMYVAKERRSRVEVYARAIDRYDPRRLALLTELAGAIEREELVVHYQPIVRLDTGEVVGAEALVRWQHPELGLLGPDEFIPMAEASGDIVALTHFVTRRALADCARWRRGARPLTVAVNLSPIALHDADLADCTLAALAAEGLPASALKVEITETGAMRDFELAVSVLGRLRAHGVEIALDDFGTGHSSLAYLRRLPVDVIKIDKSFVLDMTANDDDRAIVASTIELAHSLGLRTIAEGVENVAAWQALREQGGDLVQGYYVSRPLPNARFAAWLADLDGPFAALDASALAG